MSQRQASDATAKRLECANAVGSTQNDGRHRHLSVVVGLGLLVGYASSEDLSRNAALALVVGVPTSMLEQWTLTAQTMDDALEVTEFPEANAENPRIAPRTVADVQTRGSVSYRPYRLGSSDIARMEDGRLAWSYPIEPDGFRNTTFEHQQGVVMSDMTRMENRELLAVGDHEFAIGEGMALHRSADWNLKSGDYWNHYHDDPVEFVHDGTPYMNYPKTGHEWHWTPLPYTTSYVTVMEPYGEDTRGLDEVWFADASTGEYRYHGTGSDTLTGPERAMGTVQSADSQTSWGSNFEVIEPIPVTIDGQLWWHSEVVTEPVEDD